MTMPQKGNLAINISAVNISILCSSSISSNTSGLVLCFSCRSSNSCTERGREGGREGGREREREGGREEGGKREGEGGGGKERGRGRGREREREGGKEGGRKGREGEREIKTCTVQRKVFNGCKFLKSHNSLLNHKNFFYKKALNMISQ